MHLIDTCTIFVSFKNKHEYQAVYNAISDFTRDIPNGRLHQDDNDKTACVTYALANLGFENIRLRQVNKDKFSYYAIEVLLHPKLLIEKNNYVDVLSVSEIAKTRSRFNSIIQDLLGLDLPDFLYWRVSRIDYAIDLFIHEQLLPKYFFYFKKGNIPNKFLNHPVTARCLSSEHGFYLYSDNVTVNIYARYPSMLDRQVRYRKSFTNIDEAINTMRVEIQYRIDAYSLKKDKRIARNELRYFLNLDWCQNIIGYYFNSVIGKGHYYSFAKASEIIDQKEVSFKEQQKLKRMLKLICQKGSLWEAKNAFIHAREDKKKAAKEFSRIINRIRDYDINPVTLLPSEDITEMEGISEKITNYFIEIRRSMLIQESKDCYANNNPEQWRSCQL